MKFHNNKQTRSVTSVIGLFLFTLKKTIMQKIKFYLKKLIYKIMNLQRFEVVDRVILDTGLICIHIKDHCSGAINVDVIKNDVL